MKKVVYKKTDRILEARSKKSRIISFLVGIVTVLVLAVVVFQFVKTTNYKKVLGAHTQFVELKQVPQKIK